MNTRIKFLILAIAASALLVLALYVVSYAANEQGSDPAAPEPLVLTDEQGEYPLGLHMEILEDPSGELTIEDVSSPAFDSRFIPSQVETPIYGSTNSAYWVRLNIYNKTPLTDLWLLEIGYPNTHYVDLYSPSQNGEGFTVKETGSLRPPETRDIRFPRIIFSLVIPTQSQQTIYLRFKSGASMTLPLTLWDKNTFINKSIPKDGLLVVFYGAMVGLLAYNIFLLFSIREVSYLYLVLFLAGFVFFLGSYDGYAEIYFFPKLYYLKPYYHFLSFSIIFISMILFADTVLEFKTRLPFFHRIMIFLLAVWGILVLLIPFTSYHFMARPMTVWAILTSILLLVGGIILWIQGYTPVRYYLIAWFGFLVSVSLVLLVRLGFAASNFVTENAFRLGLVWVALGWSLVLADRVNLLRTETEVANRNLRNSEHRLSQILEGMPLGVVVYGKDHKPKFTSQRTFSILSNPAQGIRPDIGAGRTLEQAMEYYAFQVAGSGEKYPVEKIPVYSALYGESTSVADVEVKIGDKNIPLEIWASPIKNEAGDVESVVAVFEDITQRRQTESELAEYRKHLEELVETRTAELEGINQKLQLGIEWLSLVNEYRQTTLSDNSLTTVYEELSAGIFQILNPTVVFVLHWDFQSGKSEIPDCFVQGAFGSGIEIIKASFQKTSPLRQAVERGTTISCSIGQIGLLSESLGGYFQEYDIQFSIFAPLNIGESIIGVLAVAVNRSSQDFIMQQVGLIERMAFDLASLTQNTILLEQAFTLTAIKERDRLARDLHDSVTQVLFSSTLLAEVLPQIWRRNPEEGLQKLDKLRQLSRGALAEMRTLLLELRPSSLVNTPLADLLLQLAEAVISRSGLPFQLFIEQIPSLPETVQINFYRIAQEALNNIVKHSHAKKVTMRLSATPVIPAPSGAVMYEIMLMIQDDGIGYSVGSERPGHLGLGIMKERAAAIPAVLSIESLPGTGTQITLTWRGVKQESSND